MSSIWGKVSPSYSKGGSLSLDEYVQFSQPFSMCYGISLLFEKLSGGCPLQARADGRRDNHRALIDMRMMGSLHNKGQVAALN